MAPAPIVDVFIARDGARWRLYVAPGAWCPPMVHDHLNAQGEASIANFDAAELERFLWAADAPHALRSTATGGAQIEARGRSAIVLAEWLAAKLDERPAIVHGRSPV